MWYMIIRYRKSGVKKDNQTQHSAVALGGGGGGGGQKDAVCSVSLSVCAL